jgi:small-conductance mechanosensitive channel
MTAKSSITLTEKLLLLVVSIVAIFLSWIIIRSWLLSFRLDESFVRFIDIGLVIGTGIVATMLLTRFVARPVATHAGATQSNAVKLLLQLSGLVMIAVAVVFLSSPTGESLISALVGIGFFGIVIGLAAQEVLGNLFSGLMLLASRPFHINDRIALITWQYGKFAPSMTHGWLEPAYTGVVKGLSLNYTMILTDSNALLRVPNRIVTQSLVLNHSYSRQGHIAIQFEAPIAIEPDELRKKLNSQLSKMSEFKGEEESYEVLEISPSTYLVALSFKIERQHEREMKDLLLRAIRRVLYHFDEKDAKQAHAAM